MLHHSTLSKGLRDEPTPTIEITDIFEHFVGKTCDYDIHWRTAEADHSSSEEFRVDRYKVLITLDKLVCGVNQDHTLPHPSTHTHRRFLPNRSMLSLP